MPRLIVSTLIILALAVISGCEGTNTFHTNAHPGDTIAIGSGWKQYFSRDNITVTFHPSSGPDVTYYPDDPAIRAVVNLYPDPVSSLVISERTSQNLTSDSVYLSSSLSGITGGDRDWWQTVVFVDLPTTVAAGLMTVTVSNPEGESVSSQVYIFAGLGNANRFGTTFGQLGRSELTSLERLSNYLVTFSTPTTVPSAIQVDFTHDPDKDHSGTGRAHVVNPIGDYKGVNWYDDGSNLRVIMTPADSKPMDFMTDFKFYVTGGINNLSLVSVQAFDMDGVAINGVTANIDYDDITLSDI